MRNYDLSVKDMRAGYFHFTKRSNLKSIEKLGLVPQKGEHAEHIEKTGKVFFVEGLDNLLILFDCWINVYKKVPMTPKVKVVYGSGAKAMRSRYFPMFLVDAYFACVRKSKRHERYAFGVFEELLKDSVLLKLELEEGEDFTRSDIDEIKVQNFRRRHLIELGYSEKYSDVRSTKMDAWNLHTRNGRGVSEAKIRLCRVDGADGMREVLKFALEHTKLDLWETCPVLCDYLKSVDSANFIV